MNALRIPINWSGLEPLTPGHFDGLPVSTRYALG